MTTGRTAYPDQPQAPQRGLTRTELGRDISGPQAESQRKK